MSESCNNFGVLALAIWARKEAIKLIDGAAIQFVKKSLNRLYHVVLTLDDNGSIIAKGSTSHKGLVTRTAGFYSEARKMDAVSTLQADIFMSNLIGNHTKRYILSHHFGLLRSNIKKLLALQSPVLKTSELLYLWSPNPSCGSSLRSCYRTADDSWTGLVIDENERLTFKELVFSARYTVSVKN